MNIQAIEQFVRRGQAAQAAVDAIVKSSEGGERGTRSRPESLNPTPFLNRAAVRNFLLEYARATKFHKFERVSGQTLVDVQGELRVLLERRVRRLPSKGKTI